MPAKPPTEPGTEREFAPKSVVRRVTARVLPDGRGRVLLLHGWDPARPDAPFWFTIGGACEPEETLIEAAVRELREEPGFVVDPALGQPVATHQHEFGWDGITLIQNETCFAASVAEASVSFAGMESIELDTIDRAEWWFPTT